MVIQSKLLSQTLNDLKNQEKTGTLFITIKDGQKLLEASINFVRGKISKAQYEGLENISALEALSYAETESIHFEEAQDFETVAATKKESKTKSTQRQGFGIFPRVLLAMLFIAALPISGFWYSNNILTQEQLATNVEEILQLTAGQLNQEVVAWLDTNIRSLEQNATVPAVVSMQTDQQKPILETMLNAYEWSYLVFSIGADGYKTARSDDNPILSEDGTKNHFRGDRDYFTQVVAGEPIGQQLLVSRTTGKPAICLSTAIPNTGGVLAQCSALDSVSDTVASTKIGCVIHKP